MEHSLRFYIQSDEETIGIVYRKRFCNSYEFINNLNELQSIVILTGNSIKTGKKFEINDADGALIGIIQESKDTFIPSFHILLHDGTLQAYAFLNFWGTTISIYDPSKTIVIGELTRPFFRFDGDFEATLFFPNYIDPRIFVPFLAIQSDIEDLE